MNDSLDGQILTILQETMRLLLLGNRAASLAQMRAILTQGPEGALLRSCLAYIEREWPGESQAPAILRDFYNLPTAEIVALRAKATELFSGSSFPGYGEAWGKAHGMTTA